jgi:transposase
MRHKRKTAEKDCKEEVFAIGPYTHKELAQLYNVSWLTFQKWIKGKEDEIGKKQGHFYHIHQVRKIFMIFGIPKCFKITMQEVEDMFNQ